MSADAAAPSPQRYARAAGLLYLVIFLCAPFGMLIVPERLMVPGDAAATAANVVASEGMLRLSFLTDAIVFCVEVVLPVLLYVLLRPVSQPLALVAALFRVAQAVVQGVNLGSHLAPLTLLSGADYLAAFPPAQLNALALLALEAHQHGILISQVFFGLHCLVLGYLVYRSGYFPWLLGVLLMAACFGYLIETFTIFLFPGNEAVTYPGLAVAAIAELAFTLWLLIKGVNLERWSARVAHSR